MSIDRFRHMSLLKQCMAIIVLALCMVIGAMSMAPAEVDLGTDEPVADFGVYGLGDTEVLDAPVLSGTPTSMSTTVTTSPVQVMWTGLDAATYGDYFSAITGVWLTVGDGDEKLLVPTDDVFSIARDGFGYRARIGTTVSLTLVSADTNSFTTVADLLDAGYALRIQAEGYEEQIVGNLPYSGGGEENETAPEFPTAPDSLSKALPIMPASISWAFYDVAAEARGDYFEAITEIYLTVGSGEDKQIADLQGVSPMTLGREGAGYQLYMETSPEFLARLTIFSADMNDFMNVNDLLVAGYALRIVAEGYEDQIVGNLDNPVEEEPDAPEFSDAQFSSAQLRFAVSYDGDTGLAEYIAAVNGVQLSVNRVNYDLTAASGEGYRFAADGDVTYFYVAHSSLIAGAAYTITVQSEGYQDGVIIGIVPGGSGHRPPLTLTNGTISNVTSYTQSISWNLRAEPFNYSNLESNNILNSITKITVDGEDYYKTTGALAGQKGFTAVMGTLTIYPIKPNYTSGNKWSAIYNDITIHFTSGEPLVLTETHALRNYPVLSRDNASLEALALSGEFRVIWVGGAGYYDSIYEITVNGETYTYLNGTLDNIPTSTNQTKGYFAKGLLALPIDIFYGNHEIVIKARGYKEQTIIVENAESERPFVTTGFRIDMLRETGLMRAPEGIDDYLNGMESFTDSYVWRGTTPDAMFYFGQIYEITAYTDAYPEGIVLERRYIGNNDTFTGTQYAYWNSGSFGFDNLSIRTNGVIMSYPGDPATDKINRLVIKATGYPDYDTDSTGGINHGTRKFAWTVNPAANVQRDEIADPETGEKTFFFDNDIVLTFAENPEFAAGVSGISVEYSPDRNRAVFKNTFDLSPEDFWVDGNTIVIDRQVFLDGNGNTIVNNPALGDMIYEMPVMTDYVLTISADGYFNSKVAQFIGSTDPFVVYDADLPSVVLIYDDGNERREVILTQKEIMIFAAANSTLEYSVEANGVLYTEIYYNGTRSGGINFNNMRVVDVRKLFIAYMGLDLVELAYDEEYSYTLKDIATDLFGGTAALEAYFGAERGYFPQAGYTKYQLYPDLSPVPAGYLVMNLDYFNGTLVMGEILYGYGSFAKNSLSRSTIGQGWFKGHCPDPGYFILTRVEKKPQVEATFPVNLNGLPLEETAVGSGVYKAYIDGTLTFNDRNRAVYYSISWDGEPEDPIASYRTAYGIGYNLSGAARTMFDRAGTATVKFMTDGSMSGLRHSEVLTYTFVVSKSDQETPVGLTGSDGVILGTTAAMEYSSDKTTWSPCYNLTTYVQGGSYYVRYAETAALYASPETAAITVGAPTKATQAAPAGVAGLMPEDAYVPGLLTGTTTDMEYRAVSGGVWESCYQPDTFVSPNTYYVRYQATETLYASVPVTITVDAFVRDYEGIRFEVVDERTGMQNTYYLDANMLAEIMELDEIELDEEEIVYDYTTVNTYGSIDNRSGSGPRVEAILEYFGISTVDANQIMTFSASDGYSASMTWGYLTDENRYYYPNANVSNVNQGEVKNPAALVGAVKVPATINLDYGNGTLMFGQRYPNEETQNMFVGQIDSYQLSTNTVGRIIITNAQAGSYSELTPDRVNPLPGETVASGTKLSFYEEGVGGNKEGFGGYIYYTTDMDNEDPAYTWTLYNYNTYTRDPLNPTAEKFNNPTITEDSKSIKVAVYGPLGTMSGVTTFGYALNGEVVDPGDGDENPAPPIGALNVYQGGEVKKDFSLAELEALGKTAAKTYSAYNTWPSYDPAANVSGYRIADILTAAGISDLSSNTAIRFLSADGFSAIVTYGQLMEDRYFFNQYGFRGDKVEAVLFESSHGLRLAFGQLVAQEQTKSAFIEDVVTIIVLEDAGSWGSVTATPDGGGEAAAGTEIRLSGYSADAKIYYTLDGSIPTMASAMYNICADRWLGQKEMTGHDPIIAPSDESFTITARIIGWGKEAGPVATFTYNAGGVVPTYLLGDVNGNGRIDISDARAVINHYLGRDEIVGEAALLAADVNSNDRIDISDARAIINHYLGRVLIEQ